MVKSLHEKSENSEQFNPSERYSAIKKIYFDMTFMTSIQSSHNSAVVSRLVEQLNGKYQSKYSPKRMKSTYETD